MAWPRFGVEALSLHAALPISSGSSCTVPAGRADDSMESSLRLPYLAGKLFEEGYQRSEEHTSELQSRGHLVCRLLLEKKKKVRRGNSHTATTLCQRDKDSATG